MLLATLFFISLWFNTLAQSENILFSDNFDDNRNGWKLFEDDEIKREIVKGVFRIENKTQKYNYFVWKEIEIDKTKDFFVKAAIKAEKIKSGYYGLSVMAWGWSDSWNLVIKPSGWFKIIHYKKGKKLLLKDGFINNFNAQKFNTFIIIKQNSKLFFVLNDTVLYFTQFEDTKGNNYGFVVPKSSIIEADYIKIVQIEKKSKSQNLKKPLSIVNTAEAEIAPYISADGKTLYFSRSYDQDIEDLSIWVTHKDDNGEWSKPEKIPGHWNEFGPIILVGASPNNKIYYIQGIYDEEDGEMIDENGISFSQKTKDSTTLPQTITIKEYYNFDNSGGSTVSADGDVVIYSAYKYGGYGERDLYVSFRISDTLFSEGINLGPQINTKGDEVAPFLAADKKTLYFSSDGHPGFGKKDIFMSKRLDDTWTNWSEPVNLGKVINHKWNDIYITVTPNNNLAFFVYKTKKGFYDIFYLKLDKKYAPEPIVVFYGTVKNSKNNKPIKSAKIEYSISQDSSKKFFTKTDNAGNFQIILNYGTIYKIKIQKENFETQQIFINLQKQGKYKEIRKQFFLKPQKKKIIVKNIYFEAGKAELTPQAYEKLDEIVLYLKENPQAKIKIIGHTNNLGDPKKLKKLSKQRAENVKNYLISKKISDERIQTNGYGSEKPIASNNTEQGRLKNQRVEIKIIN